VQSAALNVAEKEVNSEGQGERSGNQPYSLSNSKPADSGEPTSVGFSGLCVNHVIAPVPCEHPGCKLHRPLAVPPLSSSRAPSRACGNKNHHVGRLVRSLATYLIKGHLGKAVAPRRSRAVSGSPNARRRKRLARPTPAQSRTTSSPGDPKRPRVMSGGSSLSRLAMESVSHRPRRLIELRRPISRLAPQLPAPSFRFIARCADGTAGPKPTPWRKSRSCRIYHLNLLLRSRNSVCFLWNSPRDPAESRCRRPRLGSRRASDTAALFRHHP
jgi:hypothetical protein